jgi:DNA-3-methyladenine glycosylase
MMERSRVLDRQFFDRGRVTVAWALLGKLLLHDDGAQLLVGRIIETEAALAANNPASHSYCGQTPHNTAMFGPVVHNYGGTHLEVWLGDLANLLDT